MPLISLILQPCYISLHCFSIWVSVQESLQASVPSPHASNAQESVGGRPPAFQNISPVSRAHGAPDTSELARILPQKYRRKLVSVEEIEYIQVSLLTSFFLVLQVLKVSHKIIHCNFCYKDLLAALIHSIKTTNPWCRRFPAPN